MIKQIKYILIFILGMSLLGFNYNSDDTIQIEIHWIKNLRGDFEFRKQWNYLEGVYRNKFGQLTCDGICPDGIELMNSDDGKIYADSLTRFYELVDTTHQFHSILCEAWCYEWAGTDFIKARQINKNQIKCSSQTNAGTHCSLILELFNDYCIPKIDLNSIYDSGLKTYYCRNGYIKIDKDFWEKGILKAEFSFDFINTDDRNIEIFWKGKIYTMIEK